MKTIQKIKYLIPICLIAVFMWNCEDDLPKVEELPSPDMAFTYEVVDEAFQLDYYVGSNIQFINTSKANGEPNWDFGDGNTAQGDTVVHQYAQPGTYQVKLTIEGKGSLTQKIFISDIKPILTLNPIEGGICEVLTGRVSFNVIVPNPQNLPVEYKWIFPEGTKDENGHDISIFEYSNPGEITFSNVGSQKVRLQVKLGGRELDETSLNVPVGYKEPVSTLYYAAKDGNIMALKLVTDAPQGMKIYPFDMGVKSGQHPLNILFNDTSLYILDCGKQFTYINDVDGVLGDGRILVMSKDGSKVETMLTNKGAAFDDPFYGYIESGKLYFSDRNTGFANISLSERNKSFSRSEFPYY
ncbi:MAG: PKD domain-containing protein, partial [Chitinophagaceae bacterium]|nr:PKD domain-containing protein [Chitinophagaceae bacterium]